MRDGAQKPLVIGLDVLDRHDKDLPARMLQFAVAERANIKREVGGQKQHRFGGFRCGEQLPFPRVPGMNLVDVDEDVLGPPAVHVDEPLPDREGIALLLAFVGNEQARQGSPRTSVNVRTTTALKISISYITKHRNDASSWPCWSEA